MTEKSEAKPKTTRKQEDKGEEVPELDRLREEGLRRNPLYQTQNLDTTDIGGGPVDLRTVSPVFEQARRDAVRHAADVVDPDTDTQDPNVILPDDEAERERVEEDLRTEADKLPDADEETRSGYGDGMGDLYNEEGQTAQRQEEEKAQADAEKDAASKTSSTGTKSAAKPSTTSKTTAKSTSTTRSTSK